jgi:large-conductance mechanosensitive channel
MKFLIIGFAIKFIAELVNQNKAKEEKVDNQTIHPAAYNLR